MRKITLFYIFIVLVLSGCGFQKNRYNEQRNEMESSIISTQNARVVLDDNTTALIMVTYLNNLERYEQNSVDTIALSVYFSNQDKGKEAYDIPKVMIDEENATVIQISQDDDIVKYLPTVNKWSRYYLVMGKKDVDFERIRLNVEIYPSVQALLTLQKDF